MNPWTNHTTKEVAMGRTIDGLSYGGDSILARRNARVVPPPPSRRNIERNLREAIWEEKRGNHRAATIYLEFAIKEEEELRG